MRKEILVTNYNPSILKKARELAELTFDYFDDDDAVDVEKLETYENNETTTPADIFLIAYLFVIYKEQAEKKGNEFKLSLTSDILNPHPKGLLYQEYIVAHQNYSGIPVKRKKDGTIKWVATITTIEGKERVKFWEKKRQELGIEANNVLEPGFRQKVAFANHPTKKHVCLFSGSELYIDYRYPSPSRIDLLNKIYDEELKYYDLDIFETAHLLYDVDACKSFCAILKITKKFKNVDELLEILKTEYVDKEYSPYVSPGVMSNSPDRLDGYHSYNADVRAIADTGRYINNLKRYSQDRRVYEMWSGGNWKMADRLYATFVKNGVSPDHIGPMSLGFAHRPKFQPMTASENSAKGNRMTFSDIQLLITDENNGEEVITWHSKYIWDKLKNKVSDDMDALKLSGLMRKNLHHVLIVLSILNENGHRDILESFLNPEYSFYDYEFIGFNSETGSYDKVISKKLEGKNQKNNVARYFRIAFEKLVEYADKDNRKNKIWESEKVTNMVKDLIELLNQNKNDKAKELLDEIFLDLAKIALTKF
jgi:Alw26I/Eco31I/Esp3I family type II restriction endonuclease